MKRQRSVRDRIDAVRSAAGHPVVVGVSGFCRAGKSALAREVVDRVEGAARMRGDDFLDPTRSHRRSGDWDGVERDRLASEVLQPFRARRAGTAATTGPAAAWASRSRCRAPACSWST